LALLERVLVGDCAEVMVVAKVMVGPAVSTITTSGAGPKTVACASFISSAEVARLITAAKFFHFAEDWISSGASSPVASGTT